MATVRGATAASAFVVSDLLGETEWTPEFSAENLPKNHSMMLTIPVVMYGLFRYLFLVREGDIGGAPEELLFRDRPLLVGEPEQSVRVGVLRPRAQLRLELQDDRLRVLRQREAAGEGCAR